MRLLAPLTALLLAVPLLGSAPAPQPIEIDIVRLTSIEWELGDPLPKWISDISGAEVVIQGYMFGEILEEVDEFYIVSDACQCNGSPRLSHFVQISLESGTTTHRPGMLTFRGTFTAGEEEEDGFVTSLFRLTGDFF